MMQMLLAHACLGTPPSILLTNNSQLLGETIVLVAYSPDGSLIAAGNCRGDPVYRVWRTEDLATVWDFPTVLRGGRRATSVSFAADNTVVAFGCFTGRPGEVVQVRPEATVLNLGSDDTGPYVANVLAVSPLNSNPRVLLNAGPAGIEKRSISYAGTNVSSISAPTPFPGSSQPGNATAITIANDAGTFLLGNDSGVIQRWQVEPTQSLWQTNFPNNTISAINLLPDGRQIVTLSSNLTIINCDRFWTDLRLWQIGQTNFLLHLKPDLPFFSTALTPDGQYLLTVLRDHRFNVDYDTNHLAIWRVADGQLMIRYNEDLPGVQQVAVSPDGNTFAYGREDGIVAIARMPTLLAKPEKRANQLDLEWQGGSGLYQVQQTTSVTSAVWANVGSPTAATNLAVPMTNPTAFFRVQSLTNAP
jgi:WD40 repeat protein